VHSVRILTDARPIFGNNIEKPPEAIAIIHTLKIAYHRSGRLEEQFFAFDEHDLKELRSAVERGGAEGKHSPRCAHQITIEGTQRGIGGTLAEILDEAKLRAVRPREWIRSFSRTKPDSRMLECYLKREKQPVRVVPHGPPDSLRDKS